MNPRRYKNELGLEVEPNNRIISDNAPEISTALRFIMSMSLSTDIENCTSPRLPDKEKVFVINETGEPEIVLCSHRMKSVPWNIWVYDVETPTHFVFIFPKRLFDPPTNLNDLKKKIEYKASENPHLSFSILYKQ